MVAIFVIVFIVGLVFAIAVARNEIPVRLGRILMWLGSIVALSSFFFLTWIELGPPGTILKNAEWLAQQTLVIDTLKQLPGLEQALAKTTAWTAQDVINAIDNPIKPRLLEISESGEQVNGYLMLELLFETDLFNAVSIVFALFIIVSALVIGLTGLLGQQAPKLLMSGLFTGSIFSALVMLFSLPQLDTLGARHEIFLRLLMTLAETRVSGGGGWYILGLFLIITGSVLSMTGGTLQTVKENDSSDFY